jgi:hypothetical protein
MKKIIAAVAAAGVVLALSACGDPTSPSDKAEAAQQEDISSQAVQNQPVTSDPWHQMRQNLNEIEHAENTGIQTTSFIFNRSSPDPIKTCPSIGVPIPNTASLTNPEQVSGKYFNRGGGGEWSSGVIGQMDPNGIYTPQASSGTFVICIGADGNPTPVYAEGDVDAVFGPARWDTATHSVVLTGPASFRFTKGQ